MKRYGLFIDSKIPYLVKCPYAARFFTPEDAIEANVSNLQSLYKNEKDEEMKRSRVYYYQIQGQLHITQRQYCIFTLYTPLRLKMEKNERNVLWTKNMINKLVQFYEDCVLPGLLVPRQKRIRDSEYKIKRKKHKLGEKEDKVKNVQIMKKI